MSYMLVNPKFSTYSPFFLTKLKGADDEYDLTPHYELLNKYGAQPLLDNKDGMFGFVGDNHLHPIYHDDRQQYKDIHISKIESYLKRNRYLSNKKHTKDGNENYRKLFYKRHLYKNDFENFESYEKACSENKDVSVTPYGTGDNPEQIYNRLNFLNKVKDKDFFISVSYVEKQKLDDGEDSYGGYRQHKNGGYFGTKLLKYEYLADEDNIKDGIFSFHIVTVKPSNRETIKESNFTFCKTRKNSFHHTIFDARNDLNLICYMFKDENEIHVGDGTTTLLSYPLEEIIDYKKINDDLFELLVEFESKYMPEQA